MPNINILELKRPMAVGAAVFQPFAGCTLNDESGTDARHSGSRVAVGEDTACVV
jgi:hypothetical protein